MQEIFHYMRNNTHLPISHYWKSHFDHPHWRDWNTTHQLLHLPPPCNLDPYHSEAESRKINIHHDPYIIYWGHTPQGFLSIKEAYKITTNYHSLMKEEIWERIWKINHWPKVCTFLWLVIQNKILTWENLLKRGFTGPSRCPLCCIQEETTEHFLNQCTFSPRTYGTKWLQSCTLLKRKVESIKETFEHWKQVFQKSNSQLNMDFASKRPRLENLEREKQHNFQINFTP
jgi:hypothetical protein